MALTKGTSTEVKVFTVRHIWTIQSFSSACWEETRSVLRSQSFFGDDTRKLKWTLLLYPNGDLEIFKDYVSIDLCLRTPISCYEPGIYVRYRFLLLNRSRVPQENTKFRYHRFTFDQPYKGCSKFIKKNVLLARRSSLLPDDKLTILCEIGVREIKTVTLSIPFNDQVSQVPDSRISDDLKSMFESQKCGDVIIEADGKEFLVYGGILQARSPVFAAMLTHPMEERKKKRIVISDAKHEVVREMLTYIYTDRSPNLQEMASDLLVIADKYDLERLKIMCEEALCAKLTNENAIDMLILADACNAARLKIGVINFLTAHSSDFLEKSMWENSIARLFQANNCSNLIREMANAII